jgi:uncharacterized OB-fold protein
MSRARIMAEMDRAAASGQIALQRCTVCDAVQYPPREVCAACLGDALEWRIAPFAQGAVLARTVLHHSFDASFRDALPLNVGLVRIEGGPVAVAFLAAGCQGGDAVRVTAGLDASGRAVLRAAAEHGAA